MRYAQLVMGPAGSGKVGIYDFAQQRKLEGFDRSCASVTEKYQVIKTMTTIEMNVETQLFQTYKCNSGFRGKRTG